MIKNVSLVFDDDFGVEIESNNGEITLIVNNFELDMEKSTEGHQVYKQSDTVRVFATREDIKQIIAAFQYVLESDEDSE